MSRASTEALLDLCELIETIAFDEFTQARARRLRSRILADRFESFIGGSR